MNGVRVALDWGEARIGVAACDPHGTLAYPVEVVRAGPAALGRLVALVREYEPLEIVVGLPRSLAGAEGPAAGRVRTAAAELEAALVAGGVAVPIVFVDERLTTVTAGQRLHAAGKRAKQQRSVIDAAAAVIILEQVLARRDPGSI